MCVDFRELNKFAFKDKFPIPVIEILIDDLHEAIFLIGLHEVKVSPNHDE